MAIWMQLWGTMKDSFAIGKSKAVLNAASLTAQRTFNLPDSAGDLALLIHLHSRFLLDIEFIEPESGGTITPDMSKPIYMVSAFGGAVTFQLPAASTMANRVFTIKKTDVSANDVTVTLSGGGGPDTEAAVLGEYGHAITIFSNGSQWYTVSKNPAGPHTHPISDINSLQTTLDGKQAADDTLTGLADLPSDTGVVIQDGANNFDILAIGAASATDIINRSAGDGRYAALSHTHSIADVTDLSNKFGMRNSIVNGQCMIAHGDATTTIANAYKYGAVDMIAVACSGTVTAGTLEQYDSTSMARSGKAIIAKGVSATGSPTVSFRMRIEAANAKRFVNQVASFSCRIYQDSGATINGTVVVSKANSADDFSAVTQISSANIAAPNGSEANLSSLNISMGDCSNGIQIIVNLPAGSSISNKWFLLGNLQFELGSTASDPEVPDLALEEERVGRYVRYVPIALMKANSSSNTQTYLQHFGMFKAPALSVTAAIAVTDAVTADFTQSSAGVGSIEEQSANHTRVNIANFSGMSSGTVLVPRGTGGLIIARAEP